MLDNSVPPEMLLALNLTMAFILTLYVIHAYKIKKKESKSLESILPRLQEILSPVFFLAWLGGVVIPLIIFSSPQLDVVAVIIAAVILLSLARTQQVQISHDRAVNFSLAGLISLAFLNAFLTTLQQEWLITEAPLFQSTAQGTVTLNSLGLVSILLSVSVGHTFLLLGVIYTKTAVQLLEGGSRR